VSAPRAIVYDRVSTVMQAKGGYSGGADGYQLDKCRAFCESRGWPVVGEITDVDSGAEWNIAGLAEAVERAKRGTFDRLVVFETSRFARSVGKKAVYEAELKRRGVEVVYLNVPEIDGPEGQFVSDMMGAVDALERERIRIRVMAGIQQKARGGKVVGAGVAPYGYRFVYGRNDGKNKDVPIGLEPDPERAAVVARLFRDAATTPLAEIARALTAEGVPTPTGRGARWNASALSLILKSRTYVGEWSYAGIVVAVPPLVDESTRADVVRRLGERRTARRGRGDDAEYLLRGMLTCGHCGGLLSTDRSSSWGTAADGRRATTRGYGCLRHKPRRAAMQGVERCDLVPVPAEVDGDTVGDPFYLAQRVGIEDAARHWVESIVMDPRRLAELVERADELHGSARRDHQQRVADLDAKIAHHELRMRRAGDRLLGLDDDDPRAEMYREAELREADLVKRLRVDRASLASVSVPGLSVESIERLRVVAAAYAERLGDLDRAGWRALCREVGLRGTVTLDPAGPWRLGHRRYRLAWEMRVATGNSVQSSSESWTLFSADGGPLTAIRAAA
jgi:DNA invertase Pin-like site-specific DNA recombinase